MSYAVYMTETEAAAYLTELGVKYAVGTLQKERVKGGGIPYVKLRSRVRYRIQDIQAWLDAAPVMTSTSDVKK
jgi:hypothetical protein